MNDNDIQSALGKLLSDPEAMSGIMSAASTLFGGITPPAVADVPSPPQAERAVSEIGDKAPAGAGLGGLDVAALMGMLGGTVKDDPRCNLLYALRPFLSRERSEKIEGLVKALKLASAAEKLLSKDGILQNGGH